MDAVSQGEDAPPNQNLLSIDIEVVEWTSNETQMKIGRHQLDRR